MLPILIDYLSPYAYVAFKAAVPLAQRYGLALEPRPVLLAGLLGANGTRGPAEVPNKRVYTFKDVFRKAAVRGLPLAPPPAHPFNPLLALRATWAAPAEARVRFADALFDATWAGGPGVEDPAVIAAIAQRLGLGDLVAAAETPAIKARLRAETDDAIARGVFGVPTLYVGEELFFGVDSLEFVELALQGRDPIAGVDLARWRDLPASAQRRGSAG